MLIIDLIFHWITNIVETFSEIVQIMDRLNPGIKDRHNFFLCAIFLFQKIGTNSVNHTVSGYIKMA